MATIKVPSGEFRLTDQVQPDQLRSQMRAAAGAGSGTLHVFVLDDTGAQVSLVLNPSALPWWIIN